MFKNTPVFDRISSDPKVNGYSIFRISLRKIADFHIFKRFSSSFFGFPKSIVILRTFRFLSTLFVYVGQVLSTHNSGLSTIGFRCGTHTDLRSGSPLDSDCDGKMQIVRQQISV